MTADLTGTATKRYLLVVTLSTQDDSKQSKEAKKQLKLRLKKQLT